jgi:hypothetical protein
MECFHVASSESRFFVCIYRLAHNIVSPGIFCKYASLVYKKGMAEKNIMLASRWKFWPQDVVGTRGAV